MAPTRARARSLRPLDQIGGPPGCAGGGWNVKSRSWWKSPSNGSVRPDQRWRQIAIVSLR